MTLTLTKLLAPFARSIDAKRLALCDASLDLTKKHRARMLESISDDIKKCSNFVVPEVSEAALVEARRSGVNLFEKSWHDQSAFDGGRKTFHFEHVQPVSVIRKLCMECRSEFEVQNVLEKELRVAWILKVEDVELTRLGYRSKRPSPDKAYSDAGIRLQRHGSATCLPNNRVERTATCEIVEVNILRQQ